MSVMSGAARGRWPRRIEGWSSNGDTGAGGRRIDGSDAGWCGGVEESATLPGPKTRAGGGVWVVMRGARLEYRDGDEGSLRHFPSAAPSTPLPPLPLPRVGVVIGGGGGGGEKRNTTGNRNKNKCEIIFDM